MTPPKMPRPSRIGRIVQRPHGRVQGINTPTITFPMRIESTLNKREHWAIRHRRNKSQKDTTRWVLRMLERPSLPCTITLTRIAPRKFDSDNCAAGFKGVRDAIAEWLGVDDGDERITWLYAQRRRGVGEYAVELEFSTVIQDPALEAAKRAQEAEAG